MSPSTLSAGGKSYEIFPLEGAERLPYTLRILLENALRHGEEEDAESLRRWQPTSEPSEEISFRPARVLLQDFTGVPAVVDLAAMRNAMADLGGDPSRINPQLPAELVIDHSVQVDEYASARAMFRNAELEFERNRERYAFLRWGQTAFDNFQVVPPNTGIVHQVNLEFLARVIETRDGRAFPDTLVGTDSHTTMVNGLGVLGWGVGGIEAEAAMLGEAISMLVPQVVGFKLTGKLPEGATATDLVLTVTQLLRQTGVVGKFVEYFGHGLVGLPLADRATIGNMSPEYGATCGFFPVDDETLEYLRLTGRDEERVALVEAYCKENALWHDPDHQPDVLAGRRARPRERRAVARRAAPPAGPRAAATGEADVRRLAARRSASTTATATTRRSPSRSPRATRRPPSSPGTTPRGASRRSSRAARRRTARARSRSSSTARSSSSSTAPSSSPRSPRARTRRTRR